LSLSLILNIHSKQESVEGFPICFIINQLNLDTRFLERVTPYFTNPTRVFFKLHYAEAQSLWLDATSPFEFGGSGACEKLAFFGDNMLRYHVIEILRRRHPQASAHELAVKKESYLTNAKLNECSNWFHFSHWLRKNDAVSPPLSRRKRRSVKYRGENPLFSLPGKISATRIEALLTATDQFHQKAFTELCVLGLMNIMTCPLKWTPEDRQIDLIGCGIPVYTDQHLTHVTGQLTCDPNYPHGILYSDPEALAAAFSKNLKG
jgi:hypothetical protein